MRILVVEDDAILLDGLSVGLGLAGFTVDAVANCGDAEAALAAQNYNAVAAGWLWSRHSEVHATGPR